MTLQVEVTNLSVIDWVQRDYGVFSVGDPGEFPMYGVPLDTVVRLVTGQGATLVHVESDRSCGDDWVSYRYFVRTAQS